MAYASLVQLAELLEQITHHDQSFYNPASDEKQKLESLHEKVRFLQGFLDKGGETIQFLEAQIRDVAYQAQDIIEFYISDHRTCSDFKICGGLKHLVWTIQKESGPSGIQQKYEEQLMNALEQFDSIVKELMNIQVSCGSFEEVQIGDAPTLASSSSAPDGRNKTVGIDEDLIEINERLCGESSKREIVPIVGMGGIGKTTLARKMFDDSHIAYHFDIRAWITISQEYHLHEILLGLHNSLPVSTKDLGKTNEEEFIEYAHKCLKGRRYLIIMDDMWSTEAWDDLIRAFPDDNNGNRIVITTRLTYVAEYASASLTHRMHFLDEDQSWNLLREKLMFEEQSFPPELEEIGKNIANSCGGLPLAIAVVAGILSKVGRTQYHWEHVAKDISLAMEATDKDFSKVLTLSYDHLPNNLKACFLYMGRFPEDYEISVSKLIMLWIAEGFLKPIGSKSLEEVAEACLDDLIKRNLVLIIKKRSNGKFRSCSMHDLLRDLCIRKAKEEKFLDVYTSGRDVAKRRLTIPSHVYIERVSRNDLASSSVRSVMYFGNEWGFFRFVLRLRLLRVLDITKIKLNRFAVEITELFHLRYLAFSYDSFMAEPLKLLLAMSKLRSLQTLIIHCFSYRTLLVPFPIWKFPQLRHLIMYRGNFNIYLSARIRRHFPVLEFLQTLRGLVNFKLTSKAIGMIPNLKKLKVEYTSKYKAKFSKVHLDNLVHLRELEKLSIEFNVGREMHHFPAASYALPPNLKKLTLRGCISPSQDMSIIGSLPDLEVLKLKKFHFEEGSWETNEGDFPRLKFLLLEKSNLAHWGLESTHFPCLNHLIIRDCRELEEILSAIGDIAALEMIEVGSGSKSAADSAESILEEQRSMGNETLQIRLSKVR